jgi:hypothetical protein
MTESASIATFGTRGLSIAPVAISILALVVAARLLPRIDAWPAGEAVLLGLAVVVVKAALAVRRERLLGSSKDEQAAAGIAATLAILVSVAAFAALSLVIGEPAGLIPSDQPTSGVGDVYLILLAIAIAILGLVGYWSTKQEDAGIRAERDARPASIGPASKP